MIENNEKRYFNGNNTKIFVGKSVLDEAIEYAKNNGKLVVMAMETMGNKKASTKTIKTYRKFYTCSWKTIYNELKEMEDRFNSCFHEVITGNCKIYIDLDADKTINEDIKYELITQNMINVIKYGLDCEYGITENTHKINPIILDASNDKKFSQHIIFKIVVKENKEKEIVDKEIMFMNNEMIGNFIEYYVDIVQKKALKFNNAKEFILCNEKNQYKFKVIDEGKLIKGCINLFKKFTFDEKKCKEEYQNIVDKQVYNEKKSLRIAFCTKPGDTRFLIPMNGTESYNDKTVIKNSEGNLKLESSRIFQLVLMNKNLFFDTLITYCDINTYRLPHEERPILSFNKKTDFHKNKKTKKRLNGIFGNNDDNGEQSTSNKKLKTRSDGKSFVEPKNNVMNKQLVINYLQGLFKILKTDERPYFNPFRSCLSFEQVINVGYIDENQTLLINCEHRECCVAKRKHRSNNIYFMLFLVDMKLIQRCFSCQVKNTIKSKTIAKLDNMFFTNKKYGNYPSTEKMVIAKETTEPLFHSHKKNIFSALLFGNKNIQIEQAKNNLLEII
jgi:hypothetical protein